MPALLVTMLTALFRMLMLLAFGALIERGVWTTGQVEQLAVGVGGAVFVGLWALYNHYRQRIRFLTALETPAGADEKYIDKKIKAGQGAQVLGGQR